MSSCSLCEHPGVVPFAPSPATHVDCPACGLVCLERSRHLSPDAERERYLLHQNSPEDAGYRAFLSRLADPLCERVPPGAAGLDFGCGPGPTLGVILTTRGRPTTHHDPLFAPSATALSREWDFVTCTEVVEHLREPRATWLELASLVTPGGWLGVMTQPLLPRREAAYADWAYARDPTHVALYRDRTFDWIASWLDFDLEREGDDVFLMQRPLDVA